MSKLNFATCSWKYESWKGLIYPEKEGLNYLKEYSKHFNSVEVDQWFWSLFDKNVVLPKSKDVEAYKNSVPKNFKFTIKVPNSLTLTHYYNRSKSIPLKKNPYFLSVDLFEQFLDSIKPIKERTASLIFQFEYLNKQKMSGLAEFQNQFINFYNEIPKDSPQISIELRNPNYLTSSYFKFLDQLGITNVFLEGYFMPSILNIYKLSKDFIRDMAIIRLHGPDRSGIEKISNENWNKIYINRDKELEKIIELLIDLQKRKVDVYLNVNNHYEGSAPLTIKKIKEKLNMD